MKRKQPPHARDMDKQRALESMLAIVGSNDSSLASRILRAANYNVELATNRFFDSQTWRKSSSSPPQPTLTRVVPGFQEPPPLHRPAEDSKSAPLSVPGSSQDHITNVVTEFRPWTSRQDSSALWSKKLLATLELRGTLNTGTPGLLEIGMPLFFPKIPLSSNPVKGGSRKRKPASFRILRFRRPDGVGGEFGSFSSGISRALTPLLDRGLIEIEGSCVEIPPMIQVFSSIVLSVKIFISRDFFSSDKDSTLDEFVPPSRLFSSSMASSWQEQQSGFNPVRCLVDFFRLVDIQPLRVEEAQDNEPEPIPRTVNETSTSHFPKQAPSSQDTDTITPNESRPDLEIVDSSSKPLPSPGTESNSTSSEPPISPNQDMPPLEMPRGVSGTPRHSSGCDLEDFEFDIANLPAGTLEFLVPAAPSRSHEPLHQSSQPSSHHRVSPRPSEDSALKRMLSAFDKSRNDSSQPAEDAHDGEEDQASLRMSEDQLNNLYGSGLVEHNQIVPLEPNRPDIFVSKLHRYQMQALRWMVGRETQGDDQGSTIQHPLWDCYSFSDGAHFWLNPFSLKATLIFPRAARSCKGGILADEMGMGKTVEALALIVHNHPLLSENPPGDPDRGLEIKYYDSDEDENVGSLPLASNPPKRRRGQRRPRNFDNGDSGRAVRKSPRLMQKGKEARRDGGLADSGSDCESSPPWNSGASGHEDEVISDESPCSEITTAKQPCIISPDTSISDPASLTSLEDKILCGTNEPRKTTLVVCPTSLLSQWMDEVSTHCPRLRTFLYYGEDRRDPSLSRYDIVVTSYGTLTAEAKRIPSKGSHIGKQLEFLTHKSPLLKTHWFRVILDEAHYIKNRLTETAKACFRLKSDRRWCLTGTPIQNRIDDVYSLVRFLREDPWANMGWWTKMISKPFEERDPRASKRLRAVMAPLVLRRVKSMMIDGRPILELPVCKKHEWTLEFSDMERDFYNSLYKRSQTEFQGFVDKGLVLNKYSVILTLLLRLRQACDHPFLVFGRQARTDEQYSKDIQGFIKRFVSKVSDREREEQTGASSAYINTLAENLRGKDTDCRICLDALEQPVISKCGHVFCRECISPIFNVRGLARCPICRQVISRTALMNVPSATPMVQIDFEKEWKHSAKTKHLMFWLKQLQFWEKERRKIVSERKVRHDQEYEHEPMSQSREEGDGNDSNMLVSESTNRTEKIQIDPLGKNQESDFDELATPNQSQGNEPQFEPFPAGEYMNEDAPIKCVVFSQWTLMLDLVEIPLRDEDLSFARLDGSLSQPQRVDVLRRFSQDPELAILLVSLKAGGVGLNLVTANHVFFLDCWWNPAVEEQAVQRIHRIGQKRPVHVHRFFIRDSVEERILALQQSKSNLAASVGMSSEELKKMRVQDLRALFAV